MHGYPKKKEVTHLGQHRFRKGSGMTERMTLTVAEAAKSIGISRNLAYELVRQGQIPSLRLGQKRVVVPRAALEEFLATP